MNEVLPNELKIRSKKDLIGISGKLSGLVDLLKESAIIDQGEDEEKKTNKKGSQDELNGMIALPDDD